MMKTLHVQLEDRSYPFTLARDYWGQPELIARRKRQAGNDCHQ